MNTLAKHDRSRDITMMSSALAFIMVGAFGFVTATTANAAYESAYYGYDTDNDGYLEEIEYMNYSYDTIDYNNDGYINPAEWNSYTEVWYDAYDDVTYSGYDFNYYDTNSDGYIDAVEYENAYDVNVYKAWDRDNDGVVEYSEYNYTVDLYNTYDTDEIYAF